MNSFKRKVLALHNGYIFLLIVTVSILLSLLVKILIFKDDLYFAYFEDQLSYARIEEMLASRKKWSWVGYGLAPLFFFLKTGLVTICIFTGAFFINLRLELGKIFKAVLLAETVFFIPALIKIAWFTFYYMNYTLDDVQYFQPLSLLSFFNANELDTWWVYPLKILNVFEVVYWIVLAFLLAELSTERFNRMLGMVLGSYGTGLLMWVIFVTFITLSLS
jgi:hypothetical protein